MQIKNKTILGRLICGIRELTEHDLDLLTHYLKYSSAKNYCGKIWIAFQLLITGKGFVSITRIAQLLEKHPSKEKIFEKHPNLRSLLKTHATALPHLKNQKGVTKDKIVLDVNKLREGYAVIPMDFPELRNSCIEASEKYFKQQLDEKSKSPFTYPLSEERGYRLLERKESFLIRDAQLPEDLKCYAPLAARLHEIALSVIRKIEQHLQLKENSIIDLTHATVWHQQADKINESVLRLFRYFPARAEENEPPCDSHQDLGLITIALRSTFPALEVFNLEQMQWVNVESTMADHEAVLLVGESLSTLTHQYFPACTHRVIESEKERYSFVYQLRLRHDAQIDSRHFQSPHYLIEKEKHFQITGKEFFTALRAKRVSVNKSYSNL